MLITILLNKVLGTHILLSTPMENKWNEKEAFLIYKNGNISKYKRPLNQEDLKCS